MPFDSTPADDALGERQLLARNIRADRLRTRPSCRCARWARRRRPAPGLGRPRRCRPSAGRRWDAAWLRSTEATTKPSYLRPGSSTDSTSSPTRVSVSTISASEAEVSRWSLSQERVNFICRFRVRESRRHRLSVFTWEPALGQSFDRPASPPLDRVDRSFRRMASPARRKLIAAYPRPLWDSRR